MTKYQIEVWDKSGKRLGDIRPVCSGLQWTRERNEAESLSVTINQENYNKLLKAIGYGDSPLSFIEAGRTDLRIKRNGQYLFGVNVISIGYEGDANDVTKTINATGYLNYYAHRYVTTSYHQVPQEEILYRVIEQMNREPNGDYGVRRGFTRIGKVFIRDRNYDTKEVKSLFQQMSKVIGGCDYEFTADKKLNIYSAQGVFRSDVRIHYPGNVAGFQWTRSVDNVANVIIGKGSGNGDDCVTARATNDLSGGYCYRREKVVTYNSVKQYDTLKQHVDSICNSIGMPFEIPSITLKNDVVDLNQIGVGDTVDVDFSKSGDADLSRIKGMYRIEQISCSVDENDSESVTLTFDDYNIEDIIANQDQE